MPPDKSDASTKPAFRFAGFQNPNYTIVPDEVFDELLTVLSGGELKVLLYIIRRTFGFKKDSDNISLSQMLHGIARKDGTQLDRGAGLSKPTLLQALRTLQDKNIIETERRRSAEKGDEPTVYRLSFAGGAHHMNRGQNPTPPVVKEFDQGGGKESSPRPRAKNLTTQEPVKQQTELQQFESSNLRKVTNDNSRGTEDSPKRSNSLGAVAATEDKKARIRAKLARIRESSAPSNGFVRPRELLDDETAGDQDSQPARDRSYDETRQVLVSYMTDLARELGDKAELTSTVSRTKNLMERSGLDLNAFIPKLYEARAKTQERTGSITSRGGGTDVWGQQRKTKMAYFFSVLEDLLGLKATRTPDR
jgi:DNA-binding PadR family transcriptional regulator